MLEVFIFELQYLTKYAISYAIKKFLKIFRSRKSYHRNIAVLDISQLLRIKFPRGCKCNGNISAGQSLLLRVAHVNVNVHVCT